MFLIIKYIYIYIFLEDNIYAANYIMNLINNESLILEEPLQIIYKIINNEKFIIYKADDEESNQLQSELEQKQMEEDMETISEKKRLEWGEQDTQILLDKYEIYMKLVGPMKKFKNKKTMWEKISEDIESNMGRKYTSIQVENRFKTLLKRKKDAVEHNKRSGNDRIDVPYEDQLEKIASQDDSIKPEILMSMNNTRILKNKNNLLVTEHTHNASEMKSNFQPVGSSKVMKIIPETKNPSNRNIEKESKENKKKSIQETLLELHKLKEESKERRHNEKLQLIRDLFKKDT